MEISHWNWKGLGVNKQDGSPYLASTIYQLKYSTTWKKKCKARAGNFWPNKAKITFQHNRHLTFKWTSYNQWLKKHAQPLTSKQEDPCGSKGFSILRPHKPFSMWAMSKFGVLSTKQNSYRPMWWDFSKSLHKCHLRHNPNSSTVSYFVLFYSFRFVL